MGDGLLGGVRAFPALFGSWAGGLLGRLRPFLEDGQRLEAGGINWWLAASTG